jgi:hypothetical protein
MKKTLIILSVTFSFLFSSLLAEVHEVPKQSQEEIQKNKKTNWQPWAVGVITVLIAGTGVYLVATHKGHKYNH